MSLEIRFSDDETVDEIVATGQIHLERMSTGNWCLIVSTDNTRAQFSIGNVRGAKVETKIIEIGDLPPTPKSCPECHAPWIDGEYHARHCSQLVEGDKS